MDHAMASAYCQLVARDLALDGMSRRCSCAMAPILQGHPNGSVLSFQWIMWEIDQPAWEERRRGHSMLKRLNSEGWRPGRLWHSFPSCGTARGFCREHDERQTTST
jgi:hypothetical protein